MVDSWIDKLEATEFKPLLTALFAKYVDPTLEHCRRNFKYVTPMPGVSQVMNVCKILEGILPRVSSRVSFTASTAPRPGMRLMNLQIGWSQILTQASRALLAWTFKPGVVCVWPRSTSE